MPSILILEDDITFSLMLKTWLGRKASRSVRYHRFRMREAG